MTRKKNLEAILTSMNTIRRKIMSHHASKMDASKKDKTCDFDATPSQWEVVMAVKNNEKTGIKEIAQLLGITSSAATQLVDELVHKNYLTRQGSPTDRRALLIALSENCKQKVEEVQNRKMEHFKVLFNALTDEELALYADLSQKIADRILKS